MRWFGHVQTGPATTLVRKSLAIQVEGPLRERDRPKRAWMNVVKIDLKMCNLSEDLARDRLEWKAIIHVADTNIVGTRL